MKKTTKMIKAIIGRTGRDTVHRVSTILIAFLLLNAFHPVYSQPGYIPFNVTQPPSLAVNVVSTDSVTCFGYNNGSSSVNVSGGYPPYTYQWNDPTSQTTAAATGLPPGTFTCTVSDTNNCDQQAATTVYEPLLLSVALIKTENYCGEPDSIFASVTGGIQPYTYQWSTGDTSSVISDLTQGGYTCTVTDQNGCITTDSTFLNDLPWQPIPICLVTVDTTSTKNLIVWEKPVTVGIDSFRVYREIGLNNYVHIGSVAYADLSEFTDTTGGINPMVQSYRYKLSVLDTCGTESVLSSAHRTIHLSTPQFTPPSTFDMIWTNDYEGFAISQYYILRDGNNTGNWVKIDSVTFGNLSYTDINAPTANARYLITAAPPSVCTADKMGKDYNESKSNTSLTISAQLAVAGTAQDATTGNCDGSAIATASGGVPPYTYLWDDPGLQTTATAAGLCSGAYNVTVSDASGDTVLASVTVNEVTGLPPAAAFMATTSTSIAPGDSVNFLDLSQNTPTSWLWIFTNGSPATSVVKDPSAIYYNTVGSHDVTLIAVNAFGSDTLVKTGYITVSAVGIKEDLNDGSGVVIYPNPTTGLFTVVLPGAASRAEWEVAVYDVLGREVYRLKTTALKFEIDLSAQPAGIYHLQAVAGNAIFDKEIVLK